MYTRHLTPRHYHLSLHDALPIYLTITVFTTRPDTLYGATYMVLAPEHPLVDRITPTSHRETIESYRKMVAAKSERSEEHTSELQSPCNLVCRRLLEKKKKIGYTQ